MLPQPVEKLILAALNASPGLIRLVDENIHAHKMPQRDDRVNKNGKKSLPAITYRRISSVPVRHLRGYQTSMVRLALDVWASDYGQAKETALEVQKAMFVAPVVNWLEIDQEMASEPYFWITLEYTCQEKGGFEK